MVGSDRVGLPARADGMLAERYHGSVTLVHSANVGLTVGRSCSVMQHLRPCNAPLVRVTYVLDAHLVRGGCSGAVYAVCSPVVRRTSRGTRIATQAEGGEAWKS